MKYSVKYVSRGTVYITDGINSYCVDGEGLINSDKSGADYILFQDSVRSEPSGKIDSQITEKVKSNIVQAIIDHFKKNNMTIDVV